VGHVCDICNSPATVEIEHTPTILLCDTHAEWDDARIVGVLFDQPKCVDCNKPATEIQFRKRGRHPVCAQCAWKFAVAELKTQTK